MKPVPSSLLIAALLALAVATPAQSLVAHYPFNGNANDVSGNNNHGTNHNAALVADRLGNPNSAYSFDGSTAYVEVPHSPTLTLAGSFSVEAWVKITGAYGGLVTQHVGGSNGNWLLGVNGGKLKFALSPNGLNPQFDSVQIDDDRWHHVVGIYDSQAQVVKHFVDGVMVLAAAETSLPTTTALTLRIGDEGSGGWKIQGVIDEVRIWDGVIVMPEFETFGTGCSGSNGTPTLSLVDPPRIGRPLSILVRNVPPHVPVFMATLSRSASTWGALTLPYDLTGIGMTGCTLLVSLDFSPIPLPPNSLGARLWGLTVPNDPALVGAGFFNQVFALDPPANPAGLITSNGARVLIGR